MLKESSIVAASIQEIIGITLGPYGQDVIIGDEITGGLEGCAIMSNDGAEVLRKLRVRMTHSVGLLLTDLAAAQDKEVGDGTTSAVVLAAELIVVAHKLMQSSHVSLKSVIDGYSFAAQLAAERLEGELSVSLEELLQQEHIGNDMSVFLHRIASTSLSSKSLSSCKERLATIAIQVSNGKVPPSFIEIGGGSVNDSFYVENGVCICNSKQDMTAWPLIDPPCIVSYEWIAMKIRDVREELVCVLDIDFAQLSPKQTFDINIETTLAHQLTKVGVTTIFSSQLLPLSLVAFLKHSSENELKIFDGLSRVDLQSIANCTGSEVVRSHLTITQSNRPENPILGKAQLVSSCKIGKECVIFVFQSLSSILKEHPNAVVLRGASPEIIKETHRSIHDAKCVIEKTLKSKRFVGGGGAVEASLACFIQDYAAQSSLSGEMREVMKGYANALLVLPKYLAKNAGADPLDAVSKLMHHKRASKERELYGIGLDLSKEQLSKGTLATTNMFKKGVIEPINIKARVLSFATETSTTVIRINELLEC